LKQLNVQLRGKLH